MTSTPAFANDTAAVAQSANAKGATTVISSHASAIKGKQVSSTAIPASSPNSVVGPSHNAMSNSVSPVNGKPASSHAAPNMNGPAIINSSVANGATTGGDHGRKPSSVTISAQGTSGSLPNGTAAAQNSRPNINFGNFDNASSPAPSHSVPQQNTPNSLSASIHNPASQARSPSPIPPPATASGGRPPSLQNQGLLNFGELPGANGADPNSRSGSVSQGTGISQPQHLRRESSQSGHSDMSPSINRNFPNGRGRGFAQQPYNNMHGSPMNRPNVPYRTPSNVPPFQPQGGMRGPGGSPYTANRSPAITPAAMQQQQGFYPNGAPMQQHGGYGYPQHFTPGNQPQNMYGMPNQLDPNFAGMYYPGQYGMPQGMPNMQGMPYPGAPASPRPFQPGQAGYMPNYNPAQSMSRQSSQNPERPASTVSSTAPSVPPTATTPSAAPSVTSPAPQAPSFQPRKPRESKAIAIMRPDGGGQVVVDKKTAPSTTPTPVSTATPPAAPAAAPPAQSKGPTLISSASGTPSSSTPPPRPAATTPVHIRSDSTHVKTEDQKKAEFIQQFKKQLEADQGKKEADVAASGESTDKAKADAEVVIEEEKKAAAAAEAQIKAAESAKATEEDDAEKARKEAEEKKRLEEEEEERLIAEMEAMEREEEERERAYQEKKKKAKEEADRKEAERKANEDEELKRQEREAEAREEAREKEARERDTKSTDDESAKLFASLKRPTLGPGANAAEDSGASTPATAGSPTLQPAQPKGLAGAAAGKSKPGPLTLDTKKPVEPSQPTAGMQALQSARFITATDSVEYPAGINSPNPALNPSAKGKGMKYNTEFLLQFQKVFSEKPSLDWDNTMKNTVGDTNDSARPQSARTPSMARQGSNRPPMGSGSMGPPMGNFQGTTGPRTLPVGTTSEQRFMASQSGRGPAPSNPFAGGFGGRPGGFPMGAPIMSRSGSSQALAGQGMGSGRNASARGKGSRRGGGAEEAKLAKTMPLTAGMELKPLEPSKTGWKPASIVGTATTVLPGGHMPPDVVQRKVKASLNKMTPEKFDKISDDILNIAMQSKDEQDGRTLRQVIQLTFEKACDEAHWASMYAKFCKRMLETMSPEIKDENVRDKTGTPVVGGALFRKYLLNRCQEEFERGWEINLPDKPEGENAEATMLSDEYYIAAAAKRRGLGLIQFIGELYKLDMLTIRIMHECVVRLLQFEGLPDESAVESLVKLLRTVGGKMESAVNGSAMLGTYFDRVKTVMEMTGLPSRLYYMLLDTVELRNKQWKSKDDAKGPKTIQEIHQEALAAQSAAEAERQRTSARGGGRLPAGRGDARSFSGGGMPPPDYPRNQVGMDDLKKLAARGARQSSAGPGGNFGPSMLGSRSSSGRRGGLGPLARGADDSANSSRQGTPPVKEKESGPTTSNAFSALASLEGEGEDGANQSPASSPPVAKATPAIAAALEDNKEEKA